jgi:8-oxo-dGTP pyrophosphatase MutT (NUDIX family)
VLVWVNGAFTAGKTSTARELIDLVPNSTFCDPEVLGGALRFLLPQKRLAEVNDYQDLPIWRRMVVDTAAALLAEVGGVLVVPMTLLRQEYRDEIFGGLAARRVPVCHVLLATEETILRERIAGREASPGDPEGSARLGQWACEHLESYTAALGWLTADAHVIDNSGLTPARAAQRIAAALRTGAAAACEIVQTPEPAGETLAAGVLLFDEQDRLLLVDPTYKPGWEFPGGIVENGEAPARAAIREVAEETGIQLGQIPRLLVVDWEPPRPPGYGGLRLLFDGGRLRSADAGRLRLPVSELRGWRFVSEEEAADLLPPNRYERLRWALCARRQSAVFNLEDGVPVG